MRASINTQLVRVGLVISADLEHGTGMNHMTSEPATHPVTQVSYTAVVPDRRHRILPDVVLVRRWVIGVSGIWRGEG